MAKKKPASEESPETKQQEAEENNRCFIITPVGDDNSEVRRAADGLIDAVIAPVLGDLGIDLVAPHRGYDPISITGRIVRDIVESKLVIANLTGLNPNVMYELAVRHAAAKPIVILADRRTRLPFDIKDEITVFYDNDMKGVVELLDRLRKAIDAALHTSRIDNPIIRYKQGALIELKGDAADPLLVVLERLDGVERALSRSARTQLSYAKSSSQAAQRSDELERMVFLIAGQGTFKQYAAHEETLSELLNGLKVEVVGAVEMTSGEVKVIVRAESRSADSVQLKLEAALNACGVKYDVISLREHTTRSSN